MIILDDLAYFAITGYNVNVGEFEPFDFFNCLTNQNMQQQ